jgi:hypothetical protein
MRLSTLSLAVAVGITAIANAAPISENNNKQFSDEGFNCKGSHICFDHHAIEEISQAVKEHIRPFSHYENGQNIYCSGIAGIGGGGICLFPQNVEKGGLYGYEIARLMIPMRIRKVRLNSLSLSYILSIY